MSYYSRYIGIYNEPYVQLHVVRIEAGSQKDAEEKFLEHLGKVNSGNEIYVGLISDLDIIGFPDPNNIRGKRSLTHCYDDFCNEEEMYKMLEKYIEE